MHTAGSLQCVFVRCALCSAYCSQYKVEEGAFTVFYTLGALRTARG